MLNLNEWLVMGSIVLVGALLGVAIYQVLNTVKRQHFILLEAQRNTRASIIANTFVLRHFMDPEYWDDVQNMLGAAEEDDFLQKDYELYKQFQESVYDLHSDDFDRFMNEQHISQEVKDLVWKIRQTRLEQIRDEKG